MAAGYITRSGANGSDSVAANLSTIPAWYARFRQKLGASYSTTASTARPAVSDTYPVGTFAEDWAYVGDLINRPKALQAMLKMKKINIGALAEAGKE